MALGTLPAEMAKREKHALLDIATGEESKVGKNSKRKRDTLENHESKLLNIDSRLNLLKNKESINEKQAEEPSQLQLIDPFPLQETQITKKPKLNTQESIPPVTSLISFPNLKVICLP